MAITFSFFSRFLSHIVA